MASEEFWDSLIEELANQIIERVHTKIKIGGLEPATIVEWFKDDNVSGARANVTVDSDNDPNLVHSVPVLVSSQLKPGQRAMILRDPPQAGYVIGAINADTQPCRPAAFPIPAQGIGDIVEPVAIDFVGGLNCGYEPYVVAGDTVGVIIPEDGWYAASGALSFGTQAVPAPASQYGFFISAADEVLAAELETTVDGTLMLNTSFHIFSAFAGDIVSVTASTNVPAGVSSNGRGSEHFTIQQICSCEEPVEGGGGPE